MCIFSAIFFHNGIESWFNERNRTVLRESLQVAESYLVEHKIGAMNDCVAISKTLEYHLEKFSDEFEEDYPRIVKNIDFLLDDLCGLKGVNSAILLNSSLEVIAHSQYSVNLHFLNIDYRQIQKVEASSQKGVILEVEGENPKSIIVASCFKNSSGYMYLIIEKNVDSSILSHAKNAKVAYDEYYKFLEERSSLEIAFIFMFLTVGILLLIASVAMAIIYSWRIIKPVSNLIDVSEDIINGNMEARVKEEWAYEEIQNLSKTFNHMIDQVNKQREDLVDINKKLDERIKFTGSVLAGVSSGVIGIDGGAIYIWNKMSEKLLGRRITIGECIRDVMPEIASLLRLLNKGNSSVEKEIQYRKGDNILLFLVKIENITSEDGNRFVITFNDLTNMAIAQRKAAWSEVARRVAHEIKNPLTPIQLSAERIKRKYLSQISVDLETFSSLINIIINQVGNIKRLIDEFNFFARLPEPVLKKCDLSEICKQAVLLMQNVGNNVTINFICDKSNYLIKADERLIHQSIVNLIQNAINAFSNTDGVDKNIWVSIKSDVKKVFVVVEDDGPGFPKEKMKSLATPYFTMTPKGSGLGLAIVKKIIQDHKGDLLFENSDRGGARITILFPLSVNNKND
jgi:two-component system nitrogen regulation sensor histidine kinase NtrY